MDEEPLVSVVRGTPTHEELAALVTVLLARPPAAPDRTPLSTWARSARPSMAPASWRASGLPR